MPNLTISDIIASIESANDQTLMRFEPVVFDNMRHKWTGAMVLIQQAYLDRISQDTARMIYCTSFGTYQLMGFNLYATKMCGYRGRIHDYLGRREDQDRAFHSFLAAIDLGGVDVDSLRNLASERERFARLYNGSGNVAEYAERIRTTIGSLDRARARDTAVGAGSGG